MSGYTSPRHESKCWPLECSCCCCCVAVEAVEPQTQQGLGRSGGGVYRGFQGGSPDADLACPGFQEAQGLGTLLRIPGLIFGRDTGCGSTGYGNRGTWPKLPYRPETLCCSPTCSNSHTRTSTSRHVNIAPSILRPSQPKNSRQSRHNGDKCIGGLGSLLAA